MSARPNGGRTTWRAKPCGWRDRERTVALGDEFGPAGPLVLDVLEELAKEQRGEDGQVRTGLRALARAAFLPRGTEGCDLARRVLEFGGRVGAFDDLSISDDDEMTVECRVSGFAEDQGRGYEAVRKGQQRAGTGRDEPGQCPEDGDTDTACPESGDNDASCPDGRDGVPVCPPTGQDRTGQKNTPPGPPGGEPPEFPGRKPRTGRARDLADWQRRVDAYAAHHWPAVDDRTRSGLLAAALQDQTVTSSRQAHAYVDRWTGVEQEEAA